MAQVFVHVKYCIGGQPAVGDEVTFDIELFGRDIFEANLSMAVGLRECLPETSGNNSLHMTFMFM